MKISLAIMALFLGGCVSGSNQVDFKKVKPKQRVYFGKVSVSLNGERAEKCELFMNTSLAPNMKLSEDGYVIYKTADRKPLLGKVRCLHKATERKSAWHTQRLSLEPLKRPKKRKSVNYFGHIQIAWDVDPQSTLSSAPQDPSAFRQVGLVDNSGELKLAVNDKATEAEEYLKSNWKVLEDFRMETHLVKLQNPDEDEELEEDDED